MKVGNRRIKQKPNPYSQSQNKPVPGKSGSERQKIKGSIQVRHGRVSLKKIGPARVPSVKVNKIGNKRKKGPRGTSTMHPRNKSRNGSERGGQISRRIHPHQYRPRTRHHRMTSGDVGHAINTMTYRHNHNEGVHEHDFHPRIQRHWSRNPDDGRDLGAGSYEHSHQGGMDERSSQGGKSKSMYDDLYGKIRQGRK